MNFICLTLLTFTCKIHFSTIQNLVSLLIHRILQFLLLFIYSNFAWKNFNLLCIYFFFWRWIFFFFSLCRRWTFCVFVRCFVDSDKLRLLFWFMHISLIRTHVVVLKYSYTTINSLQNYFTQIISLHLSFSSFAFSLKLKHWHFDTINDDVFLLRNVIQFLIHKSCIDID